MKRQKAFTLIEVMLALFITAMLITILAVVFNTGLRSYRQGKDLLEITRKGQLLLGQMTKELSASMIGPNITFAGSKDSVYFMAPISDDERLDLCEAGYLYDSTNKRIMRYYYTYWNESENSRNPDFNYPENPPSYSSGSGKSETFCTDVTYFVLKYRDASGWQAVYPWSPNTSLPNMVEVSVTIQGRYPTDKPSQKKTFTTWIYLPNSTNNP